MNLQISLWCSSVTSCDVLNRRLATYTRLHYNLVKFELKKANKFFSHAEKFDWLLIVTHTDNLILIYLI